ncbi:uncharacterized protein LOC143298254 [Babylonia areolata]|uniref:uncharacterized protein LOC143298254 n=1 Tax=Babylonia areolata TaxID=304850 RepID=UPI003FCF0B18
MTSSADTSTQNGTDSVSTPPPPSSPSRTRATQDQRQRDGSDESGHGDFPRDVGTSSAGERRGSARGSGGFPGAECHSGSDTRATRGGLYQAGRWGCTLTWGTSHTSLPLVRLAAEGEVAVAVTGTCLERDKEATGQARPSTSVEVLEL